MIGFEGLELRDTSPIYQQIVQFVQRGLVAGVIRSGDELPSRRVLSALLGVNPNTVQRAYRILEEEGLVQSHSGAKSCIDAGPERLAALRSQLLQTDVGAMAAALRQSGLSLEEAKQLLEKLWEVEP